MVDLVGSVDHLNCSKRSKQSPQLANILPSIKLYVLPAPARDRCKNQHRPGQPTEETNLKKRYERERSSRARIDSPGTLNYPPGSMAAMETTTAPVIRTINIKRSNRPPGSVDPVLLSRKLEAARRELEAAEKLRERRQATRDGTFVARSSTHSPDTSPRQPLSRIKESNPEATSISTRNLDSTARQSDWSTADGRPVMSHKSMFAALNLGLADLEAMTEKLSQETSKQREYLCSRCKTPDAPGQHDHSNVGENRNYSRRRSQPHLVTVKHGSQTAYERVDSPQDAPPQYHALSHRGSKDNIRDTTQRPPLQPQRHDRPDWTQQSQYGNDTPRANLFDVPSGYIFRRKTAQTGTASEVAAAQKARGTAKPPAPLKESHMISDAVKLIKAKERRAKRQSVVDFLKKL